MGPVAWLHPGPKSSQTQIVAGVPASATHYLIILKLVRYIYIYESRFIKNTSNFSDWELCGMGGRASRPPGGFVQESSLRIFGFGGVGFDYYIGCDKVSIRYIGRILIMIFFGYGY